MNLLKIESIYDSYFGSPVRNCEKSYDKEKVKNFLGQDLPEIDMTYVIGELKKEHGKFFSYRGKEFGSYNTKGIYNIDLDIIKKELENKKLRKQYIKEIQSIHKTSELLETVGLKQKLIQAALGQINLKSIIGKYLYKNTLEVAEIEHEDFEDGTESYSLSIDYFSENHYTDNRTLFNENSRLEYKFELLKYLGVISDEEYKKYTGKEVYHDPNENRKGYFQCWECGTWQPISKRQEDGTCGC